MSDDRASFIKSQTQLTTELDALGATARGDKMGYKHHNLDLDDDNESWSSDSLRHPANQPLPPSTANSGTYREPPHSPVDPSVPLFPTGRGQPPNYQDNLRSNQPSPSPYRDNSSTNLSAGYRSQHSPSPAGHRAQNNPSPWQVGAGYDH